jgi:hypothetical protein
LNFQITQLSFSSSPTTLKSSETVTIHQISKWIPAIVFFAALSILVELIIATGLYKKIPHGWIFYDYVFLFLVLLGICEVAAFPTVRTREQIIEDYRRNKHKKNYIQQRWLSIWEQVGLLRTLRPTQILELQKFQSERQEKLIPPDPSERTRSMESFRSQETKEEQNDSETASRKANPDMSVIVEEPSISDRQDNISQREHRTSKD